MNSGDEGRVVGGSSDPSVPSGHLLLLLSSLLVIESIKF